MKLTSLQLGAACLFAACVWAMFNSLESISPVVDNMPAQGSGIYVSIGSYQWMGWWRSYREENKELQSIIDQLKGSTASHSERKTTRETSDMIRMWIEITWANALAICLLLSVSLLFSSQITRPQVFPLKKEEKKKRRKKKDEKKEEEKKEAAMAMSPMYSYPPSIIGLEELQQHFGRTREDAAARLGVSVSTLKRRCRHYGIDRWPGRDWGSIRQCFDGPIDLSTNNYSIAETSETPTIRDSSICQSSCMDFSIPSISIESEGARGSYERTFQVKDQSAMSTVNQTPMSIVNQTPNSLVFAEPQVALTQMACENSGSSDNGRTSLALQERQSTWFVMIKAIHWNGNILLFQFRVASGIIGLKEELSKRLKCELDRLQVTYMDDTGDFILMTCDEDLMLYLNVFRPLGYQALFVGERPQTEVNVSGM